MRARSYIIELYGNSAVLIDAQEGAKVQQLWIDGENICVRNQCIAHSVIRRIRPTTWEEHNELEESDAIEARNDAIADGKISYLPSGSLQLSPPINEN